MLHDRAKTDEELRALAGTGGVVGVVAVPFFLGPGEDVTIGAMLDRIEYIANLVGWQHVAIGTDWPLQMTRPALARIAELEGQYGFRPEHRISWTTNLIGFDDYRDFPNITRGLVRRGYSDEQVRGILGEDFLRVFDDVCGREAAVE
jgi:membrane dipeptidase